MNWKVGYITGGLKVESIDTIKNLLQNLEKVLGYKIMMNFGPYTNSEINEFKPYVSGMGSAIESFDEELHNFICPSKSLKSLTKFLENLQKNNLKSLITIILGMGETIDHIDTTIQKIKKYNISTVQLCFLKSQENTIFNDVPPPNMDYMAYWIARLRIAVPNLIIKVALVQERLKDFSILLTAGINGFSRFMIFKDFNSNNSFELINQCKIGNRKLIGNFITLPKFNIENEVNKLNLESKLKENIKIKLKQYLKQLEKNSKLDASGH